MHSDYLGTPRLIADGSNNTVWKWDNGDVFGNNLASGNITFNLRFAGQYFDFESNFHYNISRTYNPATGRYMQSDPLGLLAGSNTYNYVGRNPMNNVDPLGLDWVNLSYNAAGDFFMGRLEGWFKTNPLFSTDSSDILNIVSHGSETHMNQSTAEEIKNQIIKGQYFNKITNEFEYSNYFQRRIREHKKITIVLDSCNTGHKGQGNFGNDLAHHLRQYLNNHGGKDMELDVIAPSGSLTMQPFNSNPFSDTLSSEEKNKDILQWNHFNGNEFWINIK